LSDLRFYILKNKADPDSVYWIPDKYFNEEPYLGDLKLHLPGVFFQLFKKENPDYEDSNDKVKSPVPPTPQSIPTPLVIPTPQPQKDIKLPSPETSIIHRETSSVLSSSEEEEKGRGKAKEDDKADSEKDSDNNVPLDSYQEAEEAEAVFKQLKEILTVTKKAKPLFEPLPPIPESQAGPSGHHHKEDPPPPPSPTPPSSPDEEVMAAVAADACWKFPEPPTFNSKARAATANSWMLLLEQYFQAPGVPQAMTDRTKIKFAFFKMSGRAAPWRDAEL
jgi:hypothetical protein